MADNPAAENPTTEPKSASERWVAQQDVTLKSWQLDRAVLASDQSGNVINALFMIRCAYDCSLAEARELLDAMRTHHHFDSDTLKGGPTIKPESLHRVERAAPDLLAACKEGLELLSHIGGPTAGKLKAAIARAEGRQP